MHIRLTKEGRLLGASFGKIGIWGAVLLLILGAIAAARDKFAQALAPRPQSPVTRVAPPSPPPAMVVQPIREDLPSFVRSHPVPEPAYQPSVVPQVRPTYSREYAAAPTFRSGGSVSRGYSAEHWRDKKMPGDQKPTTRATRERNHESSDTSKSHEVRKTESKKRPERAPRQRRDESRAGSKSSPSKSRTREKGSASPAKKPVAPPKTPKKFSPAKER
jgi:hypothetical protein